MPTKKTGAMKKESKPTGGHTAVSNLPTEVAHPSTMKTAPSKPPSEGTNPRTVQPRDEGTETVKGFRLREVTEETLAELYTAPRHR